MQAADPIEPGRINIFERWDSDEAVERFRTSGSGDGTDPDAAPLPQIVDAQVHKYRISGIEGP